jgi:hypothetical protein
VQVHTNIIGNENDCCGDLRTYKSLISGGIEMTLGIRCFPDKLAYVIAQGNISAPVVVESDIRKFPTDLTRPGFLNWVSKEVKGILLRHRIRSAAFKEIESNAQKTNASLKRAEVEGVIQAVLYENGCHDVQGVNKQELKAALAFSGPAKDIAAALVNTDLHKFRGKDEEEAALAAWSLLSNG